MRDISWDSRLETVLPIVLNSLKEPNKRIVLETSSEDAQLTKLINGVGWKEDQENLLLGRTQWRRQLNSKLIPGTRSLKSMLGRLQPQTPPLPTPSLGPR